MTEINWPSHIRFDDTQADINEARRVWIIERSKQPDSGSVAEFLEFMQAYAHELDRRRRETTMHAQESA